VKINFLKKKLKKYLSDLLFGKIFQISYRSVSHKKIFIENNLYKVFATNNSRIFTNNIEHLAIINSENKLLSQCSLQLKKNKIISPKKNIVFDSGTDLKKKNISGTVLCISQGASGNNYFHWLFDILPKIEITRRAYGSLKNIDFFFLPFNNEEYKKVTLSKLGIDKKKIIPENKIRYLYAKKIIIPAHPWFKKNLVSDLNFMPHWIIKFLTKKFKRKKIKKINKFKKIFIDRSDAKIKERQILNNNHLKLFLIKNNFTIVQLSILKFEKQIQIFNNAKIIISAHGAGLANICFCKKGTKIIELQYSNIEKGRKDIFKKISKFNNLIYKKMLFKCSNKARDIFVDKQKLERILF